MRRQLLACLALVLLAPLADALIIRITELREFVEKSSFIVEAKVESLDPKRPAVMLAVQKVVRGKTTLTKLPVLLKGNAASIKKKELPQLLERLAVNLPVVLFVSERDKELIAFAYTNGTWFAMDGQVVDGEARWVFTNLEPYLRRTFKGTTKELIELLSGKGTLPKPDPKAKPGLGDPIKKATGALLHSPPQRAVIPMVLVGGPLALLALLFPTVFAGWERWMVLISTLGTASTLLFLHWWFFEYVDGTWLASPVAVWATMTVVHLAGLAWAWDRHLYRVQTGQAPLVPGTVELLILAVMTLLGAAGLFVLHFTLKQRLLTPDWWPVVAYCAAISLAAAYALYLRVRGPRLRPALSCEAVVLLALVLVSVPIGPNLLQAKAVIGGVEAEQRETKTDVKLAWTFKLPERGAIVSSPLVVGDRVFIAAAHDDVFRPYGRLYCLKRDTGEVVWRFDNGRKMKQAFSSPVVANGRLYIGEGLHQDEGCRLYALDVRTGEKQGEFETASHTEATPVVEGDRIYAGAGDDGLYSLDRDTLTKVWQFPGFHIDTGPVVAGDGVFVGCGVGDAFKETAIFCLDAKTGKPRWRVPTELPVWTEVVVSEGRVFAGMGNGRLNEEPERPAGLVLCLDAAKGNEVWRVKMKDGVLGRLAVDRERLYFGSRDGHFYCLRRRDGGQVWRRDLGSIIVAGAALDRPAGTEATPERLYAVGVSGSLACLEPTTGKLLWARELVEGAATQAEVIATPALDTARDADGRLVRRLYVGLTLVSTARTGELRCYEEREE